MIESGTRVVRVRQKCGAVGEEWQSIKHNSTHRRELRVEPNGLQPCHGCGGQKPIYDVPKE
jgi:hypothetical protein